MRRFALAVAGMLALAVPVAWWLSAVSPYLSDIERTAAQLTVASAACGALAVNMIGVSVWLRVAPRVADYVLAIVRERYMREHWHRVRARAEAHMAMAADGGPALTDAERQTVQARQAVLALLRAAMDIEGADGRQIPRWDRLEGWSSDAWQEATGLIGRHLYKMRGGAGGGGTYLAEGYPSLRAFYRMVERGAVSLARDDTPLPQPEDAEGGS